MLLPVYAFGFDGPSDRSVLESYSIVVVFAAASAMFFFHLYRHYVPAWFTLKNPPLLLSRDGIAFSGKSPFSDKSVIQWNEIETSTWITTRLNGLIPISRSIHIKLRGERKTYKYNASCLRISGDEWSRLCYFYGKEPTEN